MGQVDSTQKGTAKAAGKGADVPEIRRVTSSPQIHHPASTRNIMWAVTLCLLPAALWGVAVFGLGSLVTLLASILAAAVTEIVISRLLGKATVLDGSAVLTGLLVGMNMPPVIPVYIPVIASVFAIAVVKWTFGGLGSNWMNPALAGRVFVFFSWTGQMTNWTVPATNPGLDAVSGATPLGFLKAGLLDYSGGVSGPMEFLNQAGYRWSEMDQSVTLWLNDTVLGFLGVQIPNGYVDLFVGNIPGSLGEVSALLLLAGSIYLLAKKIINWQIPVAYLLSFGLLVWIFGGVRFGAGMFTGDVLFHLFTGGLMLGAFYMATDMVTSPLTAKGMVMYAVGVGFLTFLIRFYGSFPEGVSLAIILMNIFVPMINRYTGPKRFGIQPVRRNA